MKKNVSLTEKKIVAIAHGSLNGLLVALRSKGLPVEQVVLNPPVFEVKNTCLTMMPVVTKKDGVKKPALRIGRQPFVRGYQETTMKTYVVGVDAHGHAGIIRKIEKLVEEDDRRLEKIRQKILEKQSEESVTFRLKMIVNHMPVVDGVNISFNRETGMVDFSTRDLELVKKMAAALGITKEHL